MDTEVQVGGGGLRLLLFMGGAGSGKSTLARRVLSRTRMTYLNKDSLWEPLRKGLGSAGEYLHVRESWYEALYAVAEDNLAAGTSVLLDAPHVRQLQDPTWVHGIRRLERRTGARLLCVYCHCRESTLRRRLLDRGLERDDWKLNNWEAFLEREPLRVPVPFCHLTVDTARPLGVCLEDIFRYLGSQVDRTIIDCRCAWCARSESGVGFDG